MSDRFEVVSDAGLGDQFEVVSDEELSGFDFVDDDHGGNSGERPWYGVDGRVFSGLGGTAKAAFKSGIKGMQLYFADQHKDTIDQLSRVATPREGAASLHEEIRQRPDQLIHEISQLNKSIEEMTPEDLTLMEQGIRSGVISISQMAPGFAASLAMKNPAPMLAAMTAQTGFDSYGSARAEGKDIAKAQIYGAIDGTIEAVTELLPAKFLVRAFGPKILAGQGLKANLKRFILTEIGGEQAATFLQSANAYANGLDEDLANAETMEEKARIQAERQAVTALATVVGVGAQSGTVAGLNAVSRRLSDKAPPKEQEIELDSRAAEKMLALAERERDSLQKRYQKEMQAGAGADVAREYEADLAALSNQIEGWREAAKMQRETEQSVSVQDIIEQDQQQQLAEEYFAEEPAKSTPVGQPLSDQYAVPETDDVAAEGPDSRFEIVEPAEFEPMAAVDLEAGGAAVVDSITEEAADADIISAAGKPFANERTATRSMKEKLAAGTLAEGDYHVAEIDGGWAIRHGKQPIKRSTEPDMYRRDYESQRQTASQEAVADSGGVKNGLESEVGTGVPVPDKVVSGRPEGAGTDIAGQPGTGAETGVPGGATDTAVEQSEEAGDATEQQSKAEALSYLRWLRDHANTDSPDRVQPGIHGGNTFHMGAPFLKDGWLAVGNPKLGHKFKVKDLWKELESEQGKSGDISKEKPTTITQDSADVRETQLADTVSDDLVQVNDVYGGTHRVKQSDLESGKQMLRTFTKGGKQKSKPLHRENLDLDGAKKAAIDAENESNPFFDVVTGHGGQPFKTEATAKAYRTKNGFSDSHDVVSADSIRAGVTGYVLKRKTVSAEISVSNSSKNDKQTDLSVDGETQTLRGKQIDSEWTAFADDAGTLNVPRAEMPQVKAEHRGALANFLKARGITGEEKTVPAASLKPTQAEFSETKVQKAKGYEGGDRAILVSSDGHILDGHHQWMAKHDNGEEVKTITLNAPIKQLLQEVQDFPSVETAGTAPEHQHIGVDDRELGEIVDEFNAAHQAMLDADFQMHHLFDAPAKKDIVRLNDKVKIYKDGHGWMTPAEAKAEVAKWKAHAAEQGKRGENSDKIVLSLFDLTGKWSQPWEEAGYQVYRFDIQEEAMNTLLGEEINVGDIHNFGHDYFADLFGSFDGNDVYAILAACPCTDFAVSGARHFAAKDADGRTVASVKLVHQTLATIEYFKPAVWAIENPVGRIEKLGGLPPWRLSFDPNHLGETYTKKTLIWGRFNADLPIAPADPVEGSKMHQQYGGKSMATKNARSATPEGFAYGFFMANNASDHPVMAIANKYDRLDRNLIEQAVDAGISEREIDEAVEDFYYQDLDDDSANQAIMDLLAEEKEVQPKTQSGHDGNELADFGEKLGGARKDQVRMPALEVDLTLDEIAKSTLSKIWPKAEVDAIEDKDAAAFARAVRDEIPNKPRKSYLVKRWAEKVQMLRGLAQKYFNDPERIEAELRSPSRRGLADFVSQIDVLRGVDRSQWDRIGRVQEHPDAYLYEGDKKIPAPQVSVVIDGSRKRYEGAKSVAEALDRINADLTGEAAEKLMKFEIRHSRKTGQYLINKVGDPEYQSLKEFDDIGEARSFIRDHNAELVALWDQVKSRENVKKTDVRNKVNKPRVGKDYRNGKDVTPEMFTETFGFRGVEFGNWVKQGKNSQERQGMLNQAFDAMMDLSDIINIPPKAISLNGTLGLGFGSRGHGSASAHYEPWSVVINLTKTKGAGTFAHEWFHALDNYFSKMRGDAKSAEREDNYITYLPEPMMVLKDNQRVYSSLRKEELERRSERYGNKGLYDLSRWELDPNHPAGVRPEVEKTFAALVEALDQSPMAKRAANMDRGKQGYWSRIIERAARSFENYIITKMHNAGYDNDYLANIKSWEDWSGKNPDKYPYLKPDEIAPVEEAFDGLFSTLKTQETDAGVMLYSKSASLPQGATPKGVAVSDAQELVNEFLATYNGAVQEEGGKPLTVRVSPSQQRAFGSAGRGQGRIKAGFNPSTNTLVLIAANFSNKRDVRRTLQHEILIHHGLGFIPEAERMDFLEQIKTLAKSDNSIGRVWESVSKNYAEFSESVKAEEVLARIAERRLSPVSRVWNDFVRWVQRMLVKIGWAKPGITQADAVELIYRIGDSFKEGRHAARRTDPNTTSPLASGTPYADLRSPVLDWYRSALSDTVSGLSKIADKNGFVQPYQAAQWLQSQQKKGAFKQEEFEWSGLAEWLEIQDDKVSVGDIQSFVDANGVQVAEVTLSKPRKPETGRSDVILAGVSETEAQSVIAGDDSGSMYLVDNGDGTYDVVQDEDDIATGGETKYSGYTLHGGKNYRELLLTIPETPIRKPYEQWLTENFTGVDSAESRRLYAIQVEPGSPYYKSSHWDQSNVLAHIRMNDRTDAEGNKVLFIEEIQSDWAQDGRKKGINDPKNNKFKVSSAGLSFGQMENFGQDIFDTEDEAKDEVKRREKSGGFHSYIKIMNGVPDAPFIKDTKAWTALAIKRVIAHAAQNGYDKVAFINGEHSADRYDLSTQIEGLQWAHYSDNQVDIFAKPIDMAAEYEKIGRYDYEKLDEVVGKELADKIIKERQSGEVNGEYTGIDLKVGGDGMKTYYDQIVPQVTRDVLKKVGGGKLESMDFNLTAMPWSEYEKYAVDHPYRKKNAPRFSGFSITDEMRETATRGLPLFSKSGRTGSDRAPWGEFPEVVFQGNVGSIKDHPDYRAAKAGDTDAALRVVDSILNDGAVNRIKAEIGDRRPTIVPVIAEEASGRNKLPLAYAHALAHKLGVEVETDIVQSVRAHHTDAGAFHRIAFQPAFDGPVNNGGDYLIVDDTLTMGGTLANLRGHIEKNGGHVLLASTLTGFPGAGKIGITEQMKTRLLNKHGEDLENYLYEEFGFGIDSLTQGEAGHIRKSPSLEAIRDRITEARNETVIGKDEGSLRSEVGDSGDRFLFSRQTTDSLKVLYNSSSPGKGMRPRPLREALFMTLKKLKGQGFNVDVLVTFDDLPEQVKEGLGGDVSAAVVRDDNNIYVVADAVSRPSDIRKLLEEAPVGDGGGDGDDSGPSAMTRLAEAVKAVPILNGQGVVNAVEKSWKKNRLAFLTRRHLADIGRRYLPDIQRYVDLAQRMDADRNDLLATTGELGERWHKWSRQNRTESKKLAELMFDTTVLGIDPSRPYEVLMTPEKLQEIKEKNRRAFKRRGSDGGDKVGLKNQAELLQNTKQAEMQLAQEAKRAAAKDDIYGRWDELTDEAKGLYEEVRDTFVRQTDMMMEALEERINASIANEESRQALIAKLRLTFENYRVQAPYFPLQRFGEYWVAVKDSDGETVDFQMFETEKPWREFAAEMEGNGYKVAYGKKIQQLMDMDGVSPSFVADVDATLAELRGPHIEEVRDQIYQLYLQTLPDLSARKHFIHRKKTPGFDTDAIRAFSYGTFHGGYQLARLRWSHRLEEVLNRMQDDVNTASDPERVDELADQIARGEMMPSRMEQVEAIQQNRALSSDLVSEMKRRHQWAMNPKGGALANYATSFGFAWYLGISPAAALVNITQVPLVALPILGAKYGYTAAGRELTKAYADYFKGGAGKSGFFSMQKSLSGDDLKAYNQFVRDGVIDKSLAHDLAGLAEDGFDRNMIAHKIMEVVSWSFHKAEVANREVTAMAAYRLARKAGHNHNGAMYAAENATWDSQFDYSTGNKARVMQSDTAKVFLMFRQFSLNMTYLLYRTAWHALPLKNASKAEKTEARRRMAGIIGMHGLAAGALGVLPEPVYDMVKALIGLIVDDEDDPVDVDAEVRLWARDMFGEKGGQVFSKGIGNAYGGIDLHSRVSLSELWLRSPSQELNGYEKGSYWIEQAAGPVFGALSNLLFVGPELWADERHFRAVEKMTPKFARDLIKTARYAKEGVTNFSGDEIVEDMTGMDFIAQAMGFTPAKVADQYDQNNALKRVETRILDRRRHLMDRFALATRLGDDDLRESTIEQIIAWNQKNPEIAISPDSLLGSLKARGRASAQSVSGIHLDKKLRNRLLEKEFITQE